MKKGIVWSQKKMRAQKVKYSGVMRKVMSNEKVARALDQSRERKEFYEMLKGEKAKEISKKDLQILSDKLAHGYDARTISQKEGRLIAEGLHEDFYSDRKKYKVSRPDFSRGTKQDTSVSSSGLKNTNAGRQSSFIRSRPGKVPAQTTTSQMTPVQMATFRNRARNLSKDEGGEQEKGRFSRAMEATMKNKRG